MFRKRCLEVVSKIFRTGAAIYTAVVVPRSTGPNRPNCKFQVLLQTLAVTVWNLAKTSPRTSARTDLAASPWQRHFSQFRPHPAVYGEITYGCLPPPTLLPCDYFLFPKMKLKLKGRRFNTIEEIQPESQSAWDSDRKGLLESVPKMEETLGPVSTCGRKLLRGWWRPIGLMVSFMIFKASVWNIFDTPSYRNNFARSGF
jgi:hypothetical protein